MVGTRPVEPDEQGASDGGKEEEKKIPGARASFIKKRFGCGRFGLGALFVVTLFAIRGHHVVLFNPGQPDKFVLDF